MKTRKFFIKGMHCVSCEKLLDDEFRQINGVKNVQINRLKNSGEVDYEETEPNFSQIKSVAKKFGYEISGEESTKKRGERKKADLADWLWAVIITITILFLFRIFQDTGIIDRINLQSANVSFGVAFLVGLVASVSSCLVVVGAVIIAFGENYKSSEKGFLEAMVKPNIFFHIGRLVTFFILGGVLGLIGGELNISGNFVSIFTIIIALVMGLLGFNILGILPSISSIGIRMPKVFTKNWSAIKVSNNKAAPFILGGMSFFLPCGFTQSMQIFALASGSFWLGGLTLFIFALGTLPALLLLGVTTSWTKDNKLIIFQKVAGMLIILFAIFTFQSGLALRGVNANIFSAKENNDISSENKQNNQPSNEQQVIEMHVNSSGFSPSTFRIKKGVPVRWVIKGDQLTSCTNKIIVPSLNISKPLKAGDNVMEFTPKETGTIPFSCWMGMVRGKFIVE